MMKHVKLFEEFKKSPMYELKPGIEFTGEGVVSVPGEDELSGLASFLSEMGYVDHWNEYNDYLKRQRGGLKIIVRWEGGNGDWHKRRPSMEGKKVMLFMGENLLTQEQEDRLQKFSDLFRFKHEHRGHNLKKFGV